MRHVPYNCTIFGTYVFALSPTCDFNADYPKHTLELILVASNGQSMRKSTELSSGNTSTRSVQPK